MTKTGTFEDNSIVGIVSSLHNDVIFMLKHGLAGAMGHTVTLNRFYLDEPRAKFNFTVNGTMYLLDCSLTVVGDWWISSNKWKTPKERIDPTSLGFGHFIKKDSK